MLHMFNCVHVRRINNKEFNGNGFGEYYNFITVYIYIYIYIPFTISVAFDVILLRVSKYN